MARPRVHQHVNPLARYFQQLKVQPIEIEKIYQDPGLPLHIDIGCGRGRFLREMARQHPDRNFLGIEIREPLVRAANEDRDEMSLKNLHYEFCNASVNLSDLIEDLPAETLQMVTIQFPDPWFKKRHAKRRMVNNRMVETIHGHLVTDGEVFVQTDVDFLAGEISEVFESNKFAGKSLESNPLPVKTEREISVENRSLPVFRFRFKKR